ncbi:hypothetical protein [Marinicrinis sediminis]|uniref:LPXTG cell wall anchor domain-containing protein n=1 Tax=Marinicrinis sediminis TaxID=1652465 RepID=A0ABW5R8H4_9BACL
MKPTRLFVCMLFLLSVHTGFASEKNAGFASETSVIMPVEVQSAAETGFTTYKEMAAANPQEFGFRTADDIEQLSLGEAYPIMGINVNKVKDKKNRHLSHITESLNRWDFIVYLHELPTIFLTVSKQPSGHYVMTEFGGNAEHFKKAVTDFKKELASKVQKEQVEKLHVVLFNTEKWIFTELENGEELATFVPASTGNDQGIELHPSMEYVKQIKQNVEANQTLIENQKFVYGSTEGLSSSNAASMVEPQSFSPSYLLIIAGIGGIGAVLYVIKRKSLPH